MAERVWTRLIGQLLPRRRMAEPVEEPQQELEPPEPELPQPEPSPEETMRERFSTEVQEGHDKPARPDYTDGP